MDDFRRERFEEQQADVMELEHFAASPFLFIMRIVKGSAAINRLLFRLPLRIVAILLRLGVVDGASGIGAHLVDRADLATFRSDAVRAEFAHFELGPLGLFFGLCLFVRIAVYCFLASTLLLSSGFL